MERTIDPPLPVIEDARQYIRHYLQRMKDRSITPDQVMAELGTGTPDDRRHAENLLLCMMAEDVELPPIDLLEIAWLTLREELAGERASAEFYAAQTYLLRGALNRIMEHMNTLAPAFGGHGIVYRVAREAIENFDLAYEESDVG